MLKKIKKEFNRFIRKTYRNLDDYNVDKDLLRGYGHYSKSYAQEGEDTVLKALMESFYKNDGYKGIYVDIGAHHPYFHSVTQYFYEK